jgi:cytochrome o ubiquinol oxidase operon protein cyoD
MSHQESAPGTTKTYAIGYILSLALTLVAYFFAINELANGWALIYSLATLAVAQLCVQLIFFLHLGSESKPRWNLTALLFAVMVVVLLVFGSLWIMKNLSYNHGLPTDQTNQQIIQDEGLSPSKY